MSDAPTSDGVEVLRCPLPTDVAGELLDFWQRVFGEAFDRFGPVLAGRESAFNDDDVYLVRHKSAIVATCRLTVCGTDGRLGLLGEVATDESCRGRGLAGRLCALARDEFARQEGAGPEGAGLGRALFLATSNLAARRLYERLGWRRLVNANVMVWQPAGDTLAAIHPSTRPGEPFTIAASSPSLRAPMVPCITRDHPWLVLDANAGIFSTRHVLQPSCEGLYARYDDIAAGRQGAWLAALATPGPVLGLASVAPWAGSAGACHRIDAFAEHARPDVWVALLRCALALARNRGAGACEVVVAECDSEKRRWLAEQGFTDAGPGEPLSAGGAVVAAGRMMSGE